MMIQAIKFSFAVILALVLLSPTGVQASRETFADIQGHWAKASIEQAVQQGYVSGFPDGSFRPDDSVTRAQFIRMLADALRPPHSLVGQPWYLPYVAAVVETGIHREADFQTDYEQLLTRLELTRLAVRATDIAFQGAGTEADDQQLVHAAVEKGILHGVGSGELKLAGEATRAQAVVVIERVLAVNRGESLPVDEAAVARLRPTDEL